jgi:hypothetical protein
MKLYLHRKYFRQDYTIGNLYIDGKYFCDVLEDTDRHLTTDLKLSVISTLKVHGKTAIPTGTYNVVMTKSTHFSTRDWAQVYNGMVPLLESVKGFDGVRIHPGNRAQDTEGCLLTGKNKVVGQLTDSKNTYLRLMDEYLWPAFVRKEDITITVGYERMK